MLFTFTYTTHYNNCFCLVIKMSKQTCNKIYLFRQNPASYKYYINRYINYKELVTLVQIFNENDKKC